MLKVCDIMVIRGHLSAVDGQDLCERIERTGKYNIIYKGERM